MIHCVGEEAIIEFEPAEEAETDHLATETPVIPRELQEAFSTLDRAESLQEMYDVCAAEIRRINGFDRVMVYRFDEEWNGTVIAENKRSDLEPFLNLRYPASDIPRQARELYTTNLLRFIPDRDYTPAPVDVVDTEHPRAALPLDMSQAVLRSVSPVHIEYLRNMGVGASMSISLLRDGALWGLIACHHYSPRYVSYPMRFACELMGRVLSLQLPLKEHQENSRKGTRLNATRKLLRERLHESGEIGPSLIDGPNETLLDVVPSTGAVVMVGGQLVRIGQTPGHEYLIKLCDWLDARDADDGDVASLDRLEHVFGTSSQNSVASGMLAVTVGAKQAVTRIIWFRPELMRTVHWAGDPAKSVVKGNAGVRLSPRGSFALWKEIVRGRCEPWEPVEIEVARRFRRDLAAHLLSRAESLAEQNMTLAAATREAERRLQAEREARMQVERMNEMKDAFVATLSHELRTPLNAIIGWAQLARRTSGKAAGTSIGPEGTDPMEIIERNARAQSQLIEDLLDVSRITSGNLRLDVQPVNLPSVIRAAIATIMPAAAAKAVQLMEAIDPSIGDEITGDPGRLQQVIWNLLSNSVKFTPKGGKVVVALKRVSSSIELSVTDTGIGIDRAFLPFVFERFRQADGSTSRRYSGLGLGLAISRHIVELHGGSVHADSPGLGGGSTFVVTLPVRVIRAEPVSVGSHSSHSTSVQAPLPPCASMDLAAIRVMVVDDEIDARGLLRAVLEECKAIVFDAGSAQSALELLTSERFDVIISDIGMPDVDGYELLSRVRELESRLKRPRTPAIALTAYARAEDRRKAIVAGFQLHVAKPVEASELVAAVASLANRL